MTSVKIRNTHYNRKSQRGKTNMKKIFALMIVATMIITSVGSVIAAEDKNSTSSNDKTQNAAISFTDVTKDTPGYDAIYKLANTGIVNGHGDGTFKPNDDLTRAELVKMINLVYGYNEPDKENFKDIKKTDWYYDYALVAKKAGYIVGFEDGSFGGEQPLTREQVCVVIDRCVELMDIDLGIKITDEISSWATDAVNKIVSNMLMPLEAGNTFRATKNITRSELAQVLASFVTEIVPEDDKKPSTNGNTSGGNSSGGNSSGGNTSGGSTSGGSTTGGNTSGGSTSGGSTSGGNTSGGSTSGGSTTGGGTSGGSTSGGSTSGGNTSGGSTSGGSTSGGSTSGGSTSGGGSTEPSFDNTEIVKNLNNAVKQIWNSGVRYTPAERAVLDHVKIGIQGSLAEADEVELTKAYIKRAYADDIRQASQKYNAMSEDAQSQFRTKIANALDTNTLNFLYSYFLSGEDIDL